MKNIIVAFISLFIVITARSQDAKPEFLKSPLTWEFERFPLPPVFATDFPYSGVEELRFAPGMFHKDSSSYFSYAFVAQLHNTKSITQQEVKNYLLTYFKGLCAATGRDRKLSIDTSKINVVLERKKDKTANAIIYSAVLNVFGVFADGAAVSLNAEIKVLSDAKASNTYLVFITSPQQKSHSIWKELYAIQKDFTIPR